MEKKQLLAAIADEAGLEWEPAVAGADDDKGDPRVPEVSVDELGTVRMVWKEGELEMHALVGDLFLTKGALNCIFSAYINENGTRKWLVDPSRMNLFSHSRKEEIRRTLDKRSQRDWTWRMAQIVVTAQQEMSKTSEPVWLHNVPFAAGSGPQWLVRPLLEKNEHTVLAAEGGTGKSLIGLACCISAGLGRPVLPDTGVVYDNSPVNSLYLDWETNAETHAQRVHQLCAGQGWKGVPKSIAYIKMTGPITEQISSIRQQIVKNKIGLVVVDSVGVATQGDINSAETALSYMRTVRAFGDVATLSITHLAKENRGTPIGSVYFREGPRSMWLAVSEQQGGSNESMIGLFHKKQNNTGRQRPIGMRAEFTTDAIRYYPESLASFSKASDHLDPEDRVLAVLSNGPVHEDSLAKTLSDIKPAVLTVTLNRLHKSGKVSRVGQDIGLSPKGEAE